MSITESALWKWGLSIISERDNTTDLALQEHCCVLCLSHAKKIPDPEGQHYTETISSPSGFDRAYFQYWSGIKILRTKLGHSE